ncbi:MAG: hypothetical protein IJS66_01500, partial [Bacteroidales bacterium]|nr:hypothetical protein [Bacteroidales bacterium]
MDKNSIIGFVLIGLILAGFTFFESGRARKQAELQQAQQDSLLLARASAPDSVAADAASFTAAGAASSAQIASGADEPAASGAAVQSVYRDSLLEAAHIAEPVTAVLENELVRIEF